MLQRFIELWNSFCGHLRGDNDEIISTGVIKPASLMNIGATCYLNSALQGISSCDMFLQDLAELHEEYHHLEKLTLFHKLIDILNGGKSDHMEISRNPIFRNWNKSGQQDSFELLAYVMNQVYNDIRKYLEEIRKFPKGDTQKWLKERLPMRIIIEYEILCSCKRQVKVPLQLNLALHVPIQKSSVLQILVNKFFDEDEIEDYGCENESCNGKDAKRYTRLIQPLPNTLCIHLQRNYWNGRKMEKINTQINFTDQLRICSKFVGNIQELKKTDENNFFQTEDNEPHRSINISDPPISCKTESFNQNHNNLFNPCENDNNVEIFSTDKPGDCKIVKQNNNNSKAGAVISTFSGINDHNQMDCDKNCSSNEISISDTNNFGNNISAENDSNKDYFYNLTSVIVHHGSVYGGHYICYKKMKDKWFLTNDSSIKEVSQKDVFKCQAYILFYEKT